MEEQILKQLEIITQKVNELTKGYIRADKIFTEPEAMKEYMIMDKRVLQRAREAGQLRYSTSTGRITYKKEDLETWWEASVPRNNRKK